MYETKTRFTVEHPKYSREWVIRDETILVAIFYNAENAYEYLNFLVTRYSS